MTMKFRAASLAGIAMIATMAMPLAVRAQDRADRPPPPPPPADFARMQARDGDDMALLLGLRPAQRPALTAFLQSMPRPPGPMHGGPRPPHGDATPGPATPGPATPSHATAPSGDGFVEHLDRMAKVAARRSADEAQRIAAARTFYAGLDPAQRRSFEALMRLQHGGPGRHGPGNRGNGPPPGGDMPPPR